MVKMTTRIRARFADIVTSLAAARLIECQQPEAVQRVLDLALSATRRATGNSAPRAIKPRKNSTPNTMPAPPSLANEALPETVLLRPNEPTVVDWSVLADYISLDADGLYDPLSPGDYELSIQRRVGCCDGPMVESNKINFEILP